MQVPRCRNRFTPFVDPVAKGVQLYLASNSKPHIGNQVILDGNSKDEMDVVLQENTIIFLLHLLEHAVPDPPAEAEKNHNCVCKCEAVNMCYNGFAEGLRTSAFG